MASQYCDICEKIIDLDEDVEHFQNHEHERVDQLATETARALTELADEAGELKPPTDFIEVVDQHGVVTTREVEV